MDCLPIASQLKSLVQFILGDKEGAKKTQENFLESGLVGSQIGSVMDAAKGDTKGAIRRQKQFIENVVDGLPIVGHMKAVYHLSKGDRESFETVMKSSSRPIGVAIGGICGFFAGGPPGAYGGGTAGGFCVDILTLIIEFAVKDEVNPSGILELLSIILKGESDSLSGDIVDLVGSLVLDGFAGISAGERVGHLQNLRLKNKGALLNAGFTKSEIYTLEKAVESIKGHHLKGVYERAKMASMARQNGNNQLARKLAEKTWLTKGDNTHNFHALWRERKKVGQVAADRYPQAPGMKRGPERIIFEDRHRNYQLNMEHYTDTHDYDGTPNARERSWCKKPFDMFADISHPAMFPFLETRKKPFDFSFRTADKSPLAMISLLQIPVLRSSMEYQYSPLVENRISQIQGLLKL